MVCKNVSIKTNIDTVNNRRNSIFKEHRYHKDINIFHLNCKRNTENRKKSNTTE